MEPGEIEDEAAVNKPYKDKTTPNNFKQYVRFVHFLDRLCQARCGFIYQPENATLLETEDTTRHFCSVYFQDSYRRHALQSITDEYDENEEKQILRQAITQNLPSALIVRKLKNSAKIEHETCTCFGTAINPHVSESLETVTFNHFIADFAVQKLEVKEYKIKNSSKDDGNVHMLYHLLISE